MTEWAVFFLTMYGLFFAAFVVVLWGTVVARIFA